MTPKTQSDKLRELSQRYRQIKEYNNSGDEFGNGYACGKEDAYTTVADELEDILSEPVAEPASAGEPPPTERFFRGDGVEEKVTYQPVTFAALRPSEPSTDSECSFLSSAGAKPCDCGEVYSEPAAPQTSAEPACQKCVEDIHGHCSGDCECRLSKCNLKVSAPQPVSAPKVEEIAKIISAKVFGWHNLENLASKEQKEACTQAAMEIIESLRRYFPPACQTPTVDAFPEWWLKEWDDALASAQEYERDAANANPESGYAPQQTMTDEEIEVAQEATSTANVRRMIAEIRRLRAATPVGTARTDGWVSVRDRLPATSGVYEVIIAHAGMEELRDGATYDPTLENEWTFSCDPYHCMIDLEVSRWREFGPLPAAPGSVPPHDPEKDFRDKFIGNWDGVPQAEPPKEEKP